MATTITVSSKDIGQEAFDVANLIGLLHEVGADGVIELGELQTEWFSHPATHLAAAPGRAKALIQTIQSFLGPKVTVSEHDPLFPGAEWYEIPDPSTGYGSGFCIVTPPAADAGGPLGLGVEHSIAIGSLTVNFFLFIPLFHINNGSDPDFVLVNPDPKKVSPIVVGVDATSTVPLTPPGAGDFTDFIIKAYITLDGKSDAFKLNIEFKNGQTTVGQYANLSDFIKADTTSGRIGALLVQGMGYWLNLNIGSSQHTIGDVLVAAKLLGMGQDGSFDYYQYDPEVLKGIGADPLQAAEDIGFAVLGALADNIEPILPLAFLTPKGKGGDTRSEKSDGGGDGEEAPSAGVWVAFDPVDANQKNNHGDYGLRIMIPDIPIALGSGPTSPSLHLRLGSWFTGEAGDEGGWVNTIVGGSPPLKPGVSVFFLNYDGKVSFAPSFELTSVGFDLVGAKDTPLLSVKGVTLGAAELRAYVNQRESGWQYGFGVRVDDVGIPLGSSFNGGATDSGGNPVAKNLLASGDNPDGQAGGDAAAGKTDAVNPVFSLKAAYVSGHVAAPEPWFVKLQPPNGATGDIVWFPVNRRFGPLECEKLGLGWNQANLLLDVVLDGGVSLSGFSAELIELSLGIPLRDPTTLSGYELGLKGLDLSYAAGGVDITGALFKSGSGDTLEYDGQALIKASNFGIAAIGSYAALKGGGTSLFVFAFLDEPLGGPAAFYVTGLAAGFGFNRKLVPPPFDQVSGFPLVKGLKDPSALGVTSDPPSLASVLRTLEVSVPPTRGEYWLAAGVMFTSFELIKSNVLLAVEFGNEFEIVILGTSVLKQPQASDVTMAYAELDIEVLIEPLAGLVEATAILSPNSYVLDKACHLTGGFAFYLWFGSNEHAGDFVLTIGGYHPAFRKPQWYPVVPRLGLNWVVSKTVEIAGGAYFALTPSCIMAGGSLHALFHSGDIRAWFDAQADMLIWWKPFSYDISMGVSIGVSVKVDLLIIRFTITVEVGADVELWGPPSGGQAHVHLWIVSFTIGFGSDRSSVQTLTDWSGFSALLPGGSGGGDRMRLAQTDPPAAVPAGGAGDGAPIPDGPVVCKISYNTGVPSTIKTDRETTWVVNPGVFSFNVETTVPITKASLKTKANLPAESVELSLPSDYFVAARPMGVGELQTPLTITITGDSDADWECTVQKGDVPEAMWGRPLPPGATPPASATLLKDRVTGLTSFQPVAHMPEGPPTIDMARAFRDVPVTQDPQKLPLSQSPTPQGAVPSPDLLSFEKLRQVASEKASDQRSALFAAFGMLGVYAGTDGSLKTMASDPYDAYRDAPMTGSLLRS